MRLAITWLGHSAFAIDLPAGGRIVTDPWLGNPNCPPELSQPAALGRVDLVLVSHGHRDHFGDVFGLARATGAVVVCATEMAGYLARKGLKSARGLGIGGTIDAAVARITMTMALHSSGLTDEDGVHYVGEAAGFVVRAAGMPTIYFAGDTGLFGDMRTIAEVYQPEIAFLPIGDHYTMGPDTAAIAARWLGVRQVVPMHWGTSPVLTGTPAELRAHLAGSGIEVLVLKPGETAR